MPTNPHHTTKPKSLDRTLSYPGEVSYGVCIDVERPERVPVLEYLPGQLAQMQVRAVPEVDDLRLSTKQAEQLLAHCGWLYIFTLGNVSLRETVVYVYVRTVQRTNG